MPNMSLCFARTCVTPYGDQSVRQGLLPVPVQSTAHDVTPSVMLLPVCVRCGGSCMLHSYAMGYRLALLEP